MAVFEFGRSAHGGRRAGVELSDLRVFPAKSKSNPRVGVGVRVSKKIMKQMRWMPGDLVTALFDEDTMQWTLRRTTNEQKGNRLSDGGKAGLGSCTVRFTNADAVIERLGLKAGEPGYDCSLVSAEADAAVFKMN